MTNHHCPPFHPADPTPSRIAVHRIVAAGSPRSGLLAEVLHDYADRLTTAGCFADLTAADARTVAATIAWDVLHGGESTELRQRAAAVTEQSWGGWDNPHGVARAFTIAAAVLEQL